MSHYIVEPVMPDVETKMSALTPATMRYIIATGKNYNPAYTHYGDDCNQIIKCDRCCATGLKECFGSGTYDLCLECLYQVQQMVDQEALIAKKLEEDKINS